MLACAQLAGLKHIITSRAFSNAPGSTPSRSRGRARTDLPRRRARADRRLAKLGAALRMRFAPGSLLRHGGPSGLTPKGSRAVPRLRSLPPHPGPLPRESVKRRLSCAAKPAGYLSDRTAVIGARAHADAAFRIPQSERPRGDSLHQRLRGRAQGRRAHAPQLLANIRQMLAVRGPHRCRPLFQRAAARSTASG